MLHFGDITKINGHQVPLVDVVTGGSPCFVQGTLITTERGLVPIEEVIPGDMVMTHKRRFKIVQDSGCTGNKPVFNLYGMGCDKITATENHPFFVRKVKKVWDNQKRRYVRVFSSPEWVSLKELSKDFYLGMPINNMSEDKLDISDEEAYLIGRYVADGYVRNGQRPDRKEGNLFYTVVFCIGKTKYSKFVSNIKAYNYSDSLEKNVYKVKIHSKRLVELCLLCGKGAENKHIPPEIINLPNSKLEYFFKGYMDGDGCFTQNKYSITTISKNLAYCLIQVISKLYQRPCSLYFNKRPKTTVIEGRTVKQHDTYQIKFTKEVRKQDHAFCEDGYIWFPMRRIEGAGVQKVYNISVKDDESYCANNVAVHNCQDLSVAGKREGLDGERSGLFMEQIRVIKEMRDECVRQLSMRGADEPIRPRFMVWENVSGAFSSPGTRNGENHKGEDFQAVLTEIVRIVKPDAPDIPLPKDRKWTKSGCLMGVGENGQPFSVAWRLHDAQFWGVPQRRKRIALVADFGGTSAPEVLFERDCLPRHFEQSGEKREATARTTQESTDTASYTLKIRGGQRDRQPWQ